MKHDSVVIPKRVAQQICIQKGLLREMNMSEWLNLYSLLGYPKEMPRLVEKGAELRVKAMFPHLTIHQGLLDDDTHVFFFKKKSLELFKPNFYD